MKSGDHIKFAIDDCCVSVAADDVVITTVAGNDDDGVDYIEVTGTVRLSGWRISTEFDDGLDDDKREIEVLP